MNETKILLSEKDIPTHWYNVQADLPKPLPPLRHPGTKEPTQLPPPLFCSEINKQEFSLERYIEIPEEVRNILKLWRPSPLFRAYRLEKALDTPANIYYKYEGVSPAGSHKLNTAVAQAYYNKKEGVKRIATETGAGQWGSAVSMACNFFNMECKVYMVKVSYNQKPYRRILMETFGATCVPSPSPDTNVGRTILKDDPNCPGTLGIAIGEACEDAFGRDDTRYALGSVLNHVLLHQTVIGLETLKQLEMTGNYPDIIIGCVGGGSNLGGLAIPFVKDKISGKRPNLQVICVEPEACPTMTKGKYTWDYGDVAGMAPIAKMHTLGHAFMPPSVHAGGLRYHGMSPLISHLYELGYLSARAEKQVPVFQAAVQFARAEGILPAPESAHAIKTAIDEANKCKVSGEKKTIVLGLSGHGHFDLASYEKYNSGDLQDYVFSEDAVKKALEACPQINE
ncbi:MAG TPA: TrpB-like pyridoxal phosphate-dependent enzyme [Chitinivibrionales bacterium]